MKPFYSVLLAIFLFAVGASAQTRIDSTMPFQTNPAKMYSIYVPSTYNASAPNGLMLGLHPFNVGVWNSVSWCDTLIAFAETNGLLMICPDGGANGIVDDAIDTAFASTLLDSMEVWYNVDTDRVYAMGFSVGGRATYTYSLNHANRIKGMIPIGAAVNGTNEVNSTLAANATCKPVYIVHGSNDSPNTRYWPVRGILNSNGAALNSLLMNGVGHTINFPNRNQILGTAFQWIDSVNTSPLVVEAGSSDTICAGETITLGGAPTAQLGACPYTYAWSNSGSLSSSTASNPVASPTAATTYALTVTDGEGNTATDSVFVFVSAIPTISISNDTAICQGEMAPLNASIAGGGGSFSWFPGFGLSCTFCPDPNASPTNNTNYTVTVLDQFGCTDAASVTVTINQNPTLSLGPTVSYCEGSSAQVAGVPSGFSYLWSPSAGLSCTNCQDPIISATASTGYQLIILDSNDCSAMDSLRVEVDPLPAITITGDTAICNGGSIQLASGGGNNYLWSPAASLNSAITSNPIASPTQTTTYQVVVGNPAGCFDSATVEVEVQDDPVPSYTYIPSFLTVQFMADTSDSNIVSWHWDFGDGTNVDSTSGPEPIHIFPGIGDYTTCLTAYSSAGCSGTVCDTLGFWASVPDLSAALSVRAYPNPTSNEIRLHGSLPQYQPVTVRLFDLTGRLVLNRQLNPSLQAGIRVDALPEGVYLLHVQQGELSGQQRLVIAR